MVDEENLEKMHFSSKELACGVSELKEFNIKTKKISDKFLPIVEGTPSAFFCEFHQEVDLKGSKTIPIIVEIKEQFIDDNIITDTKRISIEYEPLARVGKSYAKLGEKINPPQIP